MNRALIRFSLLLTVLALAACTGTPGPSPTSTVAADKKATRSAERTEGATNPAAPTPEKTHKPSRTPEKQSSSEATKTPRANKTPRPKKTRAPTETPGTPDPTSPPPTEEYWPSPMAAPGFSKAGLHVSRNNNPRIMEFVRRVKPALIYAVDDVGWLADVKAASPSTVTIGRFDFADFSVIGRVSPEEWAHTYVDQNLERYRLNLGVDYWEGWNEYRPNEPAAWDWYTRFEAERARYMHTLGLRAAVGAFSTGNPEWKEMALFLPALKAAYESGGIFTLHEYGAPTMQCLVPGGPGDAPALPGVETGALTLRYRYWYESYLKPQGLGNLKLAITEAGVDGLAQHCPGPGGAGWMDYAQFWADSGLGANSVQTYLSQIEWYDAEVRQDPYVIGFALFTIGAKGYSPGHESYDLDPIVIPLANYMAAQH